MNFVATTMAYYSLLFIFNMIIVVTYSCIYWFLQQCQVNDWILNTHFFVDVQSIYTRNEFTNRVNNFWSLYSCLLWRRLYWETSMRFLQYHLQRLKRDMVESSVIVSHFSHCLCWVKGKFHCLQWLLAFGDLSVLLWGW